MTSIVILSYNTLALTRLCIESIRTYTAADSYELIVVDNGSADGSRTWLKEQEDILLLCNETNRGFAGGCNQGMRAAHGDSLLLLNSDTIVTPHWLTNLRRALFSAPDIGAVGAMTNAASNGQMLPVHYDGLEQMESFAARFNVPDPSKWQPWFMLVGFCLLIRREAYIEIGELDEAFSPGYYEDDDYAIRLRQAGFDILLAQDTFIHHFGSVSFRKENDSEKSTKMQALNRRNRVYLGEKWGLGEDYALSVDCSMLLPAVLPKKAKVTLLDFRYGKNIYPLRARHPEAEVCGILVGACPLLCPSPRVAVRRAANLAEAAHAVQAGQDFIVVLTLAAYQEEQETVRILQTKLNGNGQVVYSDANGTYQIGRVGR